MANDLNMCIYTGRLGGPPEGKGNSCFFSIAVNRGFGDKQTTLWVKCGASGKMAENILAHAEHYTKGRRIGVVGENSESTYRAKDGTSRKSYTLWLKDWPSFMDAKVQKFDGAGAVDDNDGFPPEF